MKVLCITNMYPTENSPQFGIFIQDQVGWLKKKGVEIDIFFIRGMESRFNYLKAVGAIRQQLTDNKYDLIHAFYGLSGAVCRWLSPEIPLVMTFCGSDLYKWWQLPISRWAAQRAAAVMVRSTDMKKLLGDEQAEIIPTGVDLEVFCPISKEEARRKLGWDMQKVYIVFLADPARKEKRFTFAQSIVEYARNDIKLIDIELIPIFNESHDRIPLYLNAADALLLTSRWEGSPNAVKEALACGCPIVSVNVGDAAYWLKDIDGCFVGNPVIPEIGTALIKIIQERKRVNAQSRLKELDISVITDKIIALYQRVKMNNDTMINQ
jgi:teichuronic acid biosynthesis glycosyltransferase TuaC